MTYHTGKCHTESGSIVKVKIGAVRLKGPEAVDRVDAGQTRVTNAVAIGICIGPRRLFGAVSFTNAGRRGGVSVINKRFSADTLVAGCLVCILEAAASISKAKGIAGFPLENSVTGLRAYTGQELYECSHASGH